MKKNLFSKLLVATLVSTMLLSTVPSFATDTIAIKIVLNGQEISYTESSGFPFIDNSGRTLVPFRQTMEAFGCDVSWNQTNQIATASKNGTTVQVPIGQSYVLKGTEKVQNDTQAVVKNGKTYLPIRVVLKSFGADVEWDDKSKAVVAKSEEKSQPSNNTNSNIPNSSYANNDKDNPPVVIPPADTTPDINNLNINQSDYEEFLSHFEITQPKDTESLFTTTTVVLLFKDSNNKDDLTNFLKSMNYTTLQSYTLQIIKDRCMSFDSIGVTYMTQNEKGSGFAFAIRGNMNKNGTLQANSIDWSKPW